MPAGKVFACGSNDYGQLLTGSPGSDVVSPVETTIKSGATFCIAGDGTSAVFVGTAPPPNTPNMRIRATGTTAVKKGTESSKTGTVGSDEMIRENERLKAENEQLRNENASKTAEIEKLLKECAKKTAENTQLSKESPSKAAEIEKVASENALLLEDNKKIRKMEDENSKLKNEKREQEAKIRQQEDENQQLKSFLFAIKEKLSSVHFFDLSEYESESVIWKGATSSVKVVIKTGKDRYAQKELKDFTFESLKRFVSECEILFLLRHPCIVRVYGFNNGDEEHPPSMILSLEPMSLEQAIRDKVLDNHEKNRITVELVLGMRYIHKRNFMHRDLKPSNILLSKKKHVRITDFGLVKEEDLETSQSKGVGTMRFMAPELFEENDSVTKYDNKVDVYSFGITLIFIVTEKYPDFSLKKVVNGVAPKIEGPISAWVRDLIVRCLSASPNNRPSFAEILSILKSRNYDMFKEEISKYLTTREQDMKKEFENRILKIEAFEYQHQNE